MHFETGKIGWKKMTNHPNRSRKLYPYEGQEIEAYLNGKWCTAWIVSWEWDKYFIQFQDGSMKNFAGADIRPIKCKVGGNFRGVYGFEALTEATKDD